MNESLQRAIALKPRLRQVIYNEWISFGFFPCYASVQLRGDPTLNLSDLGNFLLSRSDPLVRLSTLLLWPFRLLQFVSKPNRDGVSFHIPTSGKRVIRFHTFFTDFYFYSTIRRMVQDQSLSQEEREKWEQILSEMVELALKNQIVYEAEGEAFRVFQFFPKSELHCDALSAGALFLRLSGLAQIDSDADDTFVLLEMFSDFLELLQADGLSNMPEEWRQSMVTSLSAILPLPYWKLVKYNQFRPNGEAIPRLNYTSIEPLGGMSTWFVRKGKSEDTPDLVVNVNVLRSMLVNRAHWGLFKSAEALETLQGIIAFLHHNVASGLFRTDRGYSFYIAEFFCAMFARLWQVLISLDPMERQQLDPEEKLAYIRTEVLSYLAQDLNPTFRTLNPLDAALALTSAIQLEQVDEVLASQWVEIICDRFKDQLYPYCAYEIFKGKIPTHMVYGSEATTAALVYDAIDELEAYLSRVA